MVRSRAPNAAIALLAAAVALGCGNTIAQPRSTVPHVGLLDAVPAGPARELLWDAFRQGMQQLGYQASDHVVYEFRSAHGQSEALAASAAELARLKVDVIVAASTPAVLAAKRATSTIPIVMANTADPVGTGLVRSLAQPGGNVTGLTTLSTELGVKRLQLLKEIIPSLSRVALLWQPVRPAVAMHDTRSAAQSLGIDVLVVDARSPEDIGKGITAAVSSGAQGLLVLPGPLLFSERRRIAEVARKQRLPAVYPQAEYVQSGGLLAYGSSLTAHFARAAYFVDRILKGSRPADLPVEQPAQFELAVNMQAAKALGVAIPKSLVVRADKVIE